VTRTSLVGFIGRVVLTGVNRLAGHPRSPHTRSQEALDSWDYQTGGKVQSSPAVAAGVVYVGSSANPGGNDVVALDASRGGPDLAFLNRQRSVFLSRSCRWSSLHWV
jgi:hypothetical protein